MSEIESLASKKHTIQIPSWRKCEATGYKDGAEVEQNHLSFVRLYISLLYCPIGRRHGINGQETKTMNPAKVV